MRRCRGSSRIRGGSSRRCIGRGCGRCGCSRGSARRRTRTPGSRSCCGRVGRGLSTAFDMPTLLGRDSDDEWSVGEVGRAGVAIDTLADMRDLFAGIDLGAVSTSMTVNSPAAILLAMYVSLADETGVPRDRVSGTLQNDILKEYQAEKEFIFPPRPSMRLVSDVVRFATAEMPRWHPVSISGYHIREAGSTAAQELAFTLANGFAYVEACVAAGLEVDEFAPRLSFFFNCHTDFFEEIGKIRAARRIWARWMRDRYGARAGEELAVSVPHPDRGRVADCAAAGGEHRPGGDPGARGGVGWHPEPAHRLATTRRWRCRRRSRCGSRCGPSRWWRTRPARRSSPIRLGGSAYVEWMTDEMERQAEEIFAYLDGLGDGSMLEGVYAAIDNGYFVDEIADAAYRFERALNDGERDHRRGQRLHRRQRRAGPAGVVADRRRHRGPAAQAARGGEAPPRRRPPPGAGTDRARTPPTRR